MGVSSYMGHVLHALWSAHLAELVGAFYLQIHLVMKACSHSSCLSLGMDLAVLVTLNARILMRFASAIMQDTYRSWKMLLEVEIDDVVVSATPAIFIKSYVLCGMKGIVSLGTQQVAPH